MTLAQFIRHLERHGASLSRWPQARRGQAQALLTANPVAASAYEKARRLESYLARHDPASGSTFEIDDLRVSRLIAGVEARMGAQVSPRVLLWTRMVDWLSDMLETRPVMLVPRFVAPLLVAALLGLWVGQEQLEQTVHEAPVVQVSVMLDLSHFISADL